MNIEPELFSLSEKIEAQFGKILRSRSFHRNILILIKKHSERTDQLLSNHDDIQIIDATIRFVSNDNLVCGRANETTRLSVTGV